MVDMDSICDVAPGKNAVIAVGGFVSTPRMVGLSRMSSCPVARD